MTMICIFNESWHIEFKEFFYEWNQIKQFKSIQSFPFLFDAMGGLSQEAGIELAYSTNAMRTPLWCQR